VRGSRELFDTRTKARSLAYIFTTGAVLGVLTLLFPHGDEVNEPPLFVLAGLAVAISGVAWWLAPRIREEWLHGFLGLGVVILTFANYWTGPTALYPIIYTWAALYAFYFFTLRVALAHLAFVALCYFVLLLIQEPPSALVRFVLAVGTPLLAGLLISNLLDSLRGQADRANTQARALRESESRTRMILESAHDAFVAIDRDGVVRRWNRAAEELFGWTAAEAVGRPLAALILPPDERGPHAERRDEMFARPSEEQVSERVELEGHRRDGTRFPMEATIARVRLQDDFVLAAFMRDLSELRKRDQERAELYREQAARAEAERVAEVVRGLQLLVDAALAHRRLDAMLHELAPRVREVLGADTAAILLTDENGGLELAATTGEMSTDDPPHLGPGQGYAGRVAATSVPEIVHDVNLDDVIDPGLREVGASSLIVVPLLAEGKVTGVIEVGAAPPRRFSQEELRLLELAADRVALTIDHARVFEREHKIAETLQRSLLPERLPGIPGIAVAARYLPAATEAEVGGDWYDVIPIPGGSVGLVMGDVAGKGLAAASMVGRLRSALRAYALEGHDPATVVERLNRLVFTELEESQMATLLYLVFDPAEGTVRWVNAGHLAPLLVVGEGLAHFLEGGRSVPLGVMPFPSFEEVSVGLEAGGSILLYTDGLVERPGAHIDDGLGLLADVVRSGPLDPEDLCAHVLRELVPKEGATDDVALLSLRNTPISERFRVEFPAEPAALASMRTLLRRWLKHAASTDREIAEITTATGEAAANAIEHSGGSSVTPFEVAGRINGREVELAVRDYGAWRPQREDDQGRGLVLMRALMDDVEVTPTPEGTTVRLRRTLDGEDA
jgi:PAS domain S-box-containing protein